MNIYPKSNHYSVIGEPDYLCHIAANLSDLADAFHGDADIFSMSINDFRTGSFEERSRKAMDWIESYYSILRGTLPMMTTMSDILFNVLFENEYTFAPDRTEESGE